MTIAWLVATGIVGKMEREVQAILPKWWKMPTSHELVPLSLAHLILSFLICLGGISLAMIAFVAETVHHKFHMQKYESPPRELVRRKNDRAINRGEKDIITLVEV